MYFILANCANVFRLHVSGSGSTFDSLGKYGFVSPLPDRARVVSSGSFPTVPVFYSSLQMHALGA